MDNKKIGKLIADLRKQKGLTQQELGDKVGVGFRAVSKWERGITLPDIGNINEISKILGITSDELLSGELNKEHKLKDKKKISSKIIKISITIVTIILLITAIFIYQNNKTYVYSLSNTTDEYNIEGEVIFKGNNISIVVNDIYFKDPQFSSTIIQNYEFVINSGEEYIFRNGYLNLTKILEENLSIKEFMDNFNINYNAKTKLKRTKIIKNGIVIKFAFLDKDNNQINKEVKLTINKVKEKEQK